MVLRLWLLSKSVAMYSMTWKWQEVEKLWQEVGDATCSEKTF